MDATLAQNIRNRQQDEGLYVPPGGEDIQEVERENDSEKELDSEIDTEQDDEPQSSEEQEDDERLGTPSQTQNIPDISVTGIIKVLQNRQGKWYFCTFSDGKDGYLEFKERHRIPQHIRDNFHKQFTWKNKKKRGKQ